MKTTLFNLDSHTVRQILKGVVKERSPLAAMRILYVRLERFFKLPLPGFHPYVVGGPDANRKVLVSERSKLLWRTPGDPVTDLLGQGVLVTDGEEHDHYRETMEPLLAPGSLPGYTQQILRHTERVSGSWRDGQVVDMLVESRRIALLIIMDTLFSVDLWDDMARLWTPILKAIAFISPGAWILFPKIPRPGYRRHIQKLDDYLYGVIRARRSGTPRAEPLSGQLHRGDLLDHLITAGLDDQTIRDQMVTMLIAGHDTSTALLAWTFLMLGKHPDVYTRLQAELDAALGGQAPSAPGGWQPALLDGVIKETLRLYPPIHLGSRRTAEPVEFEGQCVPTGERLIYSIYLTHRDEAIWEDAETFKPERFIEGQKPPAFSYVPFGGGPRACIGAAFGHAEARLIIARLLQTHRFELTNPRVYTHMGATLEPRPGVFMRVTRRTA